MTATDLDGLDVPGLIAFPVEELARAYHNYAEKVGDRGRIEREREREERGLREW